MARRKQKFTVPLPPQRSCGKNRYESEEEAELVAREVAADLTERKQTEKLVELYRQALRK